MTRLQWCEAREFLAAVEDCCNASSITVASLGLRFRRWTKEYYLHMSKKSTFKEFCLNATAVTSQRCNSGYESASSIDATEFGKFGDNAKEKEILDLAKFRGHEDSVWERIWIILRDAPELVNRRQGRSFSLLHHAAYWGNLRAAQQLVNEFNATACLCSKNGQKPFEVAFDRNHAAVGKFLKLLGINNFASPAQETRVCSSRC